MASSRNTKQKETIVKEINNTHIFFTAQELFLKAKKIDKKIGIATIYRILKNLSNKGILHSYVCQRRSIYSREKHSHCHFECEQCGKLTHIEVRDLNFLKNTI